VRIGPDLRRLAAISLLAIGCGTANIRANAPYQKDRAYLYGRFTYNGLSQTFAIHCHDGHFYKVDFVARDEVQMIELPPSTCQLERIEYGSEAMSQMAPFRLLRNEILDPGGVYYVGDYFVTGTSRTDFKFFYNETHQSWRMNPGRDEYAKTTTDMRRQFPAFARAPTQDRVDRR
jgi:hypothetical protein